MTSDSTVDPNELVLRFERYLDGLETTDYDKTHRTRFCESLRRMKPVLERDQVAIELGGLSRVASFLAKDLGWNVAEYTKDLRLPLELETECCGTVLMLEVLEHLNDLHQSESPIEEIAMFTCSGAIGCLREVNRILKPGGTVVLTTPNAASVDVIGRALLKMHPFQYEPHVREYAPRDVEAMAAAAGFTVQSSTTFFAWNALPGFDREALLKVIKQLGYDEGGRGDDSFYLLRK